MQTYWRNDCQKVGYYAQQYGGFVDDEASLAIDFVAVQLWIILQIVIEKRARALKEH